jgi:hypothetical protein
MKEQGGRVMPITRAEILAVFGAAVRCAGCALQRARRPIRIDFCLP